MTSVPPAGNQDKVLGAYAAPLKVQAQNTPNMTVAIRGGSFWTGDGAFVEYVGGNSPTIVAPGSQAYFAVVSLASNGAIVVQYGTIAASPNIPVPTAGNLPLAAIYVTSTTTTITNNIIFDVRPYVQTTYSASLAAELATFATITQLNTGLATKPDLTGTSSATWTINAGQPATTASFVVDQGVNPAVSLRYNTVTSKWQFTNDGSTFADIASSSGVFMNLVGGAAIGDVATYGVGGQVIDSGTPLANLVTTVALAAAIAPLATTASVALKADKVVAAVAGDVATLNASGNLVDGGVLLSDLATNATVVHNTGVETIAGAKTFSSNITVNNGPLANPNISLGEFGGTDMGLEVSRTAFPANPAILKWDEASETWQVGVVGVSVESILTDSILAGYIKADGTVPFDVGTAAVPTINFFGDSNTGFYHSAADEVSVSIGGAQKVLFSSAGVTVFSGFFTPGTGGAAAPEFSFTGDADTGMFRSAANTLGFAANGVSQMTVGTAGVTIPTLSTTSLTVTGTLTMTTGNLDMGGFKVVNLGTPTLATDATTKTYVDTADGANVARTDTVALTGDVTAGPTALTGPATSLGTTLANTAVTPAAYGSASAVGTFTVDAKGRLTAAVDVPILITEAQVTGLSGDLAAKVDRTDTLALTGDVTVPASALTGPANSFAATLATVNVTTGTFGTAADVGTFTVNGKGLITAAMSTPIAVDETALTFSSFTSGDVVTVDVSGHPVDSGTLLTDLALDASVVHLAGTENITGSKTFKNVTTVQGDGSTSGLQVTATNNVAVGLSSDPIAATDGFPYIPFTTTAGAPSGTPTSIPGFAPMIAQNDAGTYLLWVYIPAVGWKSTTLA